MIVAWTGHRPDLFQDPGAAELAVERAADEVVQQGAGRFLVGGQRGVDTWAALAALKRGVPFVLVLPLTVDEFTRDWLPADRALLESVLEHAEDVQTAGGYAARNQRLATEADLLMAVWTGIGGGGTEQTIRFTRELGKPVRDIMLAPSSDAAAARGRGI